MINRILRVEAEGYGYVVSIVQDHPTCLFRVMLQREINIFARSEG